MILTGGKMGHKGIAVSAITTGVSMSLDVSRYPAVSATRSVRWLTRRNGSHGEPILCGCPVCWAVAAWRVYVSDHLRRWQRAYRQHLVDIAMVRLHPVPCGIKFCVAHPQMLDPDEEQLDASGACFECKGSGDCSDCEGSGEVEHDCADCSETHTHECSACTGSGECEACDGTGKDGGVRKKKVA